MHIPSTAGVRNVAAPALCGSQEVAGLHAASFVRVLDRVSRETREVVFDVWRQATLLLAAPIVNALDKKAAKKAR